MPFPLGVRTGAAPQPKQRSGARNRPSYARGLAKLRTKQQLGHRQPFIRARQPAILARKMLLPRRSPFKVPGQLGDVPCALHSCTLLKQALLSTNPSAHAQCTMRPMCSGHVRIHHHKGNGGVRQSYLQQVPCPYALKDAGVELQAKAPANTHRGRGDSFLSNKFLIRNLNFSDSFLFFFGGGG